METTTRHDVHQATIADSHNDGVEMALDESLQDAWLSPELWKTGEVEAETPPRKLRDAAGHSATGTVRGWRLALSSTRSKNFCIANLAPIRELCFNGNFQGS
jgi:hypothetical protein